MMKKLLALSLILTFVVISCSQKTALPKVGNPVFKGWYADPEAIVFDDQYWIFPTSSAPFDDQVYLDAFSSSDLSNWTKHSRILDTVAVKWAKKAIWAPAILKKDNRYFLFFGANDMYHTGEGGIGVAVADQPQGPYADYLGRPLIDSIINGAQPIDQFVFQDKDGAYYMYYGGWKHCNVAKMKSDFTGFVPFDDGSLFKEVTPQNYVEGPFMFIRDGKYYFMWSEGDWTKDDYRVAYAIADSPFGPFERVATILESDTKIGTGAGHHSVIHDTKSDKYYIVYHRHPLGVTDGNNREVCIDEMHFDDKGFILPVVMTNEGVEANKLKE